MSVHDQGDAWKQAEHEFLQLLRKRPQDKEASYDDNARAILHRLCARLRSASTGERIEGWVKEPGRDGNGTWYVFTTDQQHPTNRRATLLLHPTDGGEG